MIVTEEYLVTAAYEAAVQTLQAAKAALRNYKLAVDYAQAHTAAPDSDLAEKGQQAQLGRDHVSDALSIVERF